MKKLTTSLIILTIVAIFALPVAAGTSIAQPNNEVQDQCTQEAKDALYKTFRESRQADQVKAYDAAKKYLACPAPAEVTPQLQAIIDYLKKWVTAYEEGSKKIKCRELLYNEQKFVEAFALCEEILAAEPENLKILVDLGANGYLVANNATLAPKAVTHATKALQMIESGKTIDDWAPLAGKDVAVAYLNYTIGAITLPKDPAAALKNLLKAAQFETPLKKSPFTYAYIAGAYETGPYAKLSEQYEPHKGKEETPESKLILANIHQIVDRMIDGYARAVALAGTDTKFAAQKPVWQEALTGWYKFRNPDKTDGLPELIAGILTKPLPPEPTPLTSLPPAPPTTTPATNTGTNGTGTTPASTPSPTPAKPNPATTTAPKPASTKPDRPRNRR